MSSIKELEIKLSNVKTIIQERKEQANNSKLPGKFQKVAIAFGERSDYGGGTYYYYGKGFHIEYCFHSQKYIRVNLGYDTKDVFAGELHQNGVADISLYIPGEWEKEIEKAFNKISKVEKNRETKRLQNAIDDLTKKWQLEGLV